MAAPMGHDRSRKPIDEEEEDDPLEIMLKKTGCIQQHYKVQDCMAEHQDWRKCQKEVTEFKQCMMEKMQKKTTS